MRKRKAPAVPPRLEAADLSDSAFARATKLLRAIRAEHPDLPFRMACNQALRQAWIEEHEALRPEHAA
jgi:hypothetical protein